MNDLELNQIAKDYAQEIINEIATYGGDSYELAHQYADSAETSIYYHKAHELCQNCNTDNGEAFLEEVGVPENPSYDGLAVVIAYGELVYRIASYIDEIEAEAADDLAEAFNA